MSREINYIVVISSMVIYVPIIVGLWYFLKGKRFAVDVKIIYSFLLVGGFFQAAQNNFYAGWLQVGGGNSLWLFHFYLPIAFLILSALFYRHLKEIIIFHLVAAFLFLIILIDCFILTGFSEYPLVSMVLYNLHFVVMPAVYGAFHFFDYRKQMKNSDSPFVFNKRMLWFCFGLLTNSALSSVLVLYSTLIGEFYLANEISAVVNGVSHLIFVMVFI